MKNSNIFKDGNLEQVFQAISLEIEYTTDVMHSNRNRQEELTKRKNS